LENYHYLADYTIVWILGGLALLALCIFFAIVYFRIKHYIDRPITLPLVLEEKDPKK